MIDAMPTATDHEFGIKLMRVINSSVRNFGDDYELDLDISDESYMDGLDSIARSLRRKKGKLYIMIDEYDRFFNESLFMKTKTPYEKDVYSSQLRSFLVKIKGLSDVVPLRTFITGISPMAIADASGANIWKSLTLNPQLGHAFGFTEQDIRGAFNTRGVTGIKQDRAMKIMKYYYNGYRFAGSKETYYNPTLAFHFLENFFADPSWIEDALDTDTLPTGSKIIKKLIDSNLTPSDLVLSLFSNSAHISILISKLIIDGFIVLDSIPLSLKFREFTEPQLDEAEATERVSSLLMAYGLLTLDEPREDGRIALKIPNELIRISFLERLVQDIELNKHDVVKCFESPTPSKIQTLLQTIVDGQKTMKDNLYGEVSLQAEIEAYLRAVQHFVPSFLVNFEHPIGKKHTFTIDSRIMTRQKRADTLIEMKSDGSKVVLEFKRVRPNAIGFMDAQKCLPGSRKNVEDLNLLLKVTDGRNPSKWDTTEYDDLKKHLKPFHDSDLRKIQITPSMRHLYKGSTEFAPTTVGELEAMAIEQCRGYMKKLAGQGKGELVGFAAVQVGWRFLVTQVKN
jgi:hypothetical protein